MAHRAYITGILAACLAATAVHSSPAYDRLVCSARSFQHYFCDLKGASTSLGLVERFVFSLALASTKAHTECPRPAPERRI